MMMDAHYSSFDDSEQFEEDSSWISDSDQDVKWCGWKRASPVSVEVASSLNDGKQVANHFIYLIFIYINLF